MEEHVSLLAERNRRQGMTPEAAMSAARRQFGNTTLLQEDRRAMQTMTKSFWALVHVAPGFRSEGILRARLSLPKASDPNDRRIAAFERELLASLRPHHCAADGTRRGPPRRRRYARQYRRSIERCR
jgi:hypothetical protein